MQGMVAFAKTPHFTVEPSPRAPGQDRSCTAPASQRFNTSPQTNLRHAAYDESFRLGSCSKDPIGYVESATGLYSFVRNGPLRFIDSNGLLAVDAGGDSTPSNRFTYSATDLDKCENNLRWDVFLGRLSGASCAADLLERFLDKTGGTACPTSCKLTLESVSIPPNGCMRDFLNAKSTCPGSGSVPLEMSGTTELADFRKFYGVVPSVDASFAFGKVNWSVSGSCKTDCSGTAKPCCCKCDARCNYTLKIVEDYDFCSSLPEGLDKFDRAACACALEKSGRGKKFKVNCSVPKNGHLQREIDMCGKKPENPGKCGTNMISDAQPTK
jgi:hypothetical protein